MMGWVVLSDIGNWDIIKENKKQWMVEEGLRSTEQFCIAEEPGILMIIREKLGISNSREHYLGIRNTTASGAAV